MTENWAAQVNAKKQEQAARDASEAARNHATRAKTHRVTLILFDTTGKKRRYFPLQDISTWPMLQISTVSGLLDRLNFSTASELEIYAGCHGGHPVWFDLDYIMEVKTDQIVYLRPVGVDIDLSLLRDKAMQLTAHSATSTPSSSSLIDLSDYPALAPKPSTKRAVIVLEDDTDTSPSPSKRYRLADPGATDDVEVVNISALENVDDIWATGAVFCPLTPKPWPHAMYVRDTAKGFELLSGTSGERLSERFPQVFPGHKFSSTTYHRNRKFWDELPLATRLAAKALPRTDDATWNVWRAKQPSWTTASKK